jgi:glycosyltransferase involved in cell wall biosynthesis
MRHVDGVIVPSELAEKAYRQCVKGIDGLRFAVVPIIHDVLVQRTGASEVFRLAEGWRRKMLKDYERAVFFVGRLDAVKNLPWLLAVAASQEWPHGVRLFLVGDGPDEKTLKAFVAEAGAQERIVFLGRKIGMELKVCYAAADCLVLCSRSETFGAVVGEAMQWGCPAVISSTVGAKGIVRSGVNGEVFEYGDMTDFIASLNRVLALRKEWMGGRESILDADLRKCVEKFVSVL